MAPDIALCAGSPSNRAHGLFSFFRSAVNPFKERGNIGGSPGSGARTELDGFWVTPIFASGPPRATADRDNGENLGQAQKRVFGNMLHMIPP